MAKVKVKSRSQINNYIIIVHTTQHKGLMYNSEGIPSVMHVWVYGGRQNLVVPPLTRVKRLELGGCLATSGCITNWLYNKTKVHTREALNCKRSYERLARSSVLPRLRKTIVIIIIYSSTYS